jgi:uncharacterized protein
MAANPLFVKYQTRSGNKYVYDPCTNEIARIADVVYRILDDFCVLDRDEIITKYRSLGEVNVSRALTQLELLQARGILCHHAPQLSSKAERVLCQGQQQSLDSFLMSRRRLLVLELTQKCNLRCEYCCYGELYPERRNHSDTTMSLDTAMNVVRDFINHSPQICSIGFYGGEPLLEFELLKQIVLFAETLGGQCGIVPDFSITTNGTLLSDEVIRFLVEHKFHILVSFDGPKETHDRYRVFRNPQQRMGSYEVVIRNVKRFVELYPDYQNRSIAVTLTATSDFDKINDTVSRLRPSFPTTLPNFVRVVSCDCCEEPREQTSSAMSSGAPFCEGEYYEKKHCYPGNGNNKVAERDNYVVCDGILGEMKKTPEFCNWTEQRKHLCQSSRDRFIQELCRANDAEAIERMYPLFCEMLRRERGRIHNRVISDRPAGFQFVCRCLPGSLRIFCSADGILYPCERTETGKSFELGNAEDGVDLYRAIRMTEAVRLLGDCGNCVARQFCAICPAWASELEDSGRQNALAFQRQCQMTRNNLQKQLAEYTTAMEANPGVVGKILQKGKTDDWVSDVRFIPTEGQLRVIELGIEELEKVI